MWLLRWYYPTVGANDNQQTNKQEDGRRRLDRQIDSSTPGRQPWVGGVAALPVRRQQLGRRAGRQRRDRAVDAPVTGERERVEPAEHARVLARGMQAQP